MASEKSGIEYVEEFISSSRGVKLFTCSWIPAYCDPKGLIFLCHGYGMECSMSFEECGIRLANVGYAVYGIDYEGHGKSSGLQCYIPNFDDLVLDCSDHFTNICEMKENRGKMRFLMGESMGGAMALLLHRKKPDYWNGAVLVAPMCKISDEMKPYPLLEYVLPLLLCLIPTWKIVPSPNIIDAAIRVPETRIKIRSNPLIYKELPRIHTSHQLLKVCLDLEARMKEVSLPFLVIHGEADKVTDPLMSKLLYESASSSDKTLKLYPGMWHSLLLGELPENIEIVFSDIIQWLDERV